MLTRLRPDLRVPLAIVLASTIFFVGARPTSAFTQAGLGVGFANLVPMGHEWVTRMAAVELLGYAPPTIPDVPDPKDPRKGWKQGLAKNTNLSAPGAQAEVRRLKGQPWNDKAYASRYKAVYDAIVGERWVDLAGYNALTSRECWDAVAQEPVEVQYDHFMRRYDDRGAAGGVTAAKGSQQRFIEYFVAAAMAPPTTMSVYDGGALGSTAVQVDRNYFLFGRAVHLFEDSFSSEHTVRIPADNYTRVRQVKSYLCAAGSEQHTHSQAAVLNYSSGDVIWNPGTQLDPSWRSYKASNMKPTALVATEATKDLWAAFIRTMGTPTAQRAAAARAEATTLVNNWLGYDEAEMLGWYNTASHRDATYVLASGQTGPGRTVQACMKGLDVGTDDQLAYVRQLEASQRKCLYNAIPWVGYSDLFDTSIHTWFAWRWRNGAGPLLDPRPDWKIPNLPADSGVRVRIKSVANGQYMSAPDGTQHDAWVYCRASTTPLDFILVGSKEDGVFRVANAPLLFLSYTNATGSVKLFNPYTVPDLDPTNYKLARSPTGWSILNSYWKQYMWLSKESPYITRKGNPANRDSQWYIDGLP